MKLGSARVLAICGALLLLAMTPASAGARSSAGRHCVFRLDPMSRAAPHVVSATLERVGCFDTLSEAIEAGSGGAIQLPRSTTPGSVTDRMISESTVARVGDDTLIGTEWNTTSYGGASNSYMAPDACAGVTYEVSYVGDTWNDRFESGKGFGGCDTNKKFVHSGFGGDVVTCSPNCTDYGALRNEVSSLRWKP
jgi:hypothetical protein